MFKTTQLSFIPFLDLTPSAFTPFPPRLTKNVEGLPSVVALSASLLLDPIES